MKLVSNPVTQKQDLWIDNVCVFPDITRITHYCLDLRVTPAVVIECSGVRTEFFFRYSKPCNAKFEPHRFVMHGVDTEAEARNFYNELRSVLTGQAQIKEKKKRDDTTALQEYREKYGKMASAVAAVSSYAADACDVAWMKEALPDTATKDEVLRLAWAKAHVYAKKFFAFENAKEQASDMYGSRFNIDWRIFLLAVRDYTTQ